MVHNLRHLVSGGSLPFKYYKGERKMRMQVQFENGRRAEGVILAASRYEMRVVMEGCANTQQWEKADGIWHDEKGERIEIDALLALEGTGWASFCAEIAARTMAIGISRP